MEVRHRTPEQHSTTFHTGPVHVYADQKPGRWSNVHPGQIPSAAGFAASFNPSVIRSKVPPGGIVIRCTKIKTQAAWGGYAAKCSVESGCLRFLVDTSEFSFFSFKSVMVWFSELSRRLLSRPTISYASCGCSVPIAVKEIHFTQQTHCLANTQTALIRCANGF